MTTSFGNGTSVTSKALNTAFTNTDADIALKANIASPTFTGTVTIPSGASITTPNMSRPVILAQGGTEGGEINLESPASGSTISGGVNIDLYVNSLRIFEGGGTNRGMTIDITSLTAGAGSTIATTNTTQTFTNKTLTSPVVNSPTGIVKADVGLGSVDNTADTAKPVSTAQQTALNLKANIASPSFTGTITNIGGLIELGAGRASSGYAYVDMVGDTTYTDFGLRVIRGNTGANAVSQIVHRGTGNFDIITQEASPLTFSTTNIERMRITSAGLFGIGTASPSTELEVVGTVTASNFKTSGTSKGLINIGVSDGAGSASINIRAVDGVTSSRAVYFQNLSGTVALTSDVSAVTTATRALVGSGTANITPTANVMTSGSISWGTPLSSSPNVATSASSTSATVTHTAHTSVGVNGCTVWVLRSNTTVTRVDAVAIVP